MWTLVAAAALIGAVLGWVQLRALRGLTYRLGDEHELAVPGSPNWVMWVTAAVWITLAVRAAVNPADAPTLLPAIPLAASGAWLAAVDLDVMRLPNRVVGPVGAATCAAVLIVGYATGQWDAAIDAAVAGLVLGGVFAVLAIVARGGLGGGDVKVAAIIGVALGGRSLTAPILAVLVGSIAALVWVKLAKRTGPFPYGPALLAGAWAAALIAGAGWVWPTK